MKEWYDTAFAVFSTHLHISEISDVFELYLFMARAAESGFRPQWKSLSGAPARADGPKIFTLNLKDRVSVGEWLGLSLKGLICTMVLPRKTKTYTTYRRAPVICTGFASSLDGPANGMITLIRGKEEGSVRRISMGGQIEGWLQRMKDKWVERKVRDGYMIVIRGWRDEHTKEWLFKRQNVADCLCFV